MLWEPEVQSAGLRGLLYEPTLLLVFVISEWLFHAGVMWASFDVRHLCICFISSPELHTYLFSQSMFGGMYLLSRRTFSITSPAFIGGSISIILLLYKFTWASSKQEGDSDFQDPVRQTETQSGGELKKQNKTKPLYWRTGRSGRQKNHSKMKRSVGGRCGWGQTQGFKRQGWEGLGRELVQQSAGCSGTRTWVWTSALM